MRLFLAEEPETVTPEHIKQAIQDCADINASGKQWAKLEILPFPSGTVVRMEVGDILSGGFHERKIQTWSYALNRDGVSVYKHTHP